MWRPAVSWLDAKLWNLSNLSQQQGQMVRALPWSSRFDA
jgi:hypothetical protein